MIYLPKFSIIFAHDEQCGIGKYGSIPWSLPSDLAHFHRVTTVVSDPRKKNVCIMGSKTWDSIPIHKRPLRQRINVIISRSDSDAVDLEDVYFKKDCLMGVLVDIFKKSDDYEKIFVIGSASLFEDAIQPPLLHFLDNIYITKVSGDYNCDVRFDLSTVLKQYLVLSRKESPVCTFLHMVRINREEEQYLNLVDKVISDGFSKKDQTGIGTLSVFGGQMKFNLRNGLFPLLTTKKLYWRAIVEELLWFLRGETDVEILEEKKVKIWSKNADLQPDRDLGPIYGFQWRHFGAKYENCKSSHEGAGFDQLAAILEIIRKEPDSRRIVMSAWNPLDIPKMALPPCHTMCQFYVADGELSCQMYQRSADMGIGIPFNIASYALLTCIIADLVGLRRGDFIHILGDTHVYKNHISALQEQVNRSPKPFPIMKIVGNYRDVRDYSFSSFKLIGYNAHDSISMDMAT